MEDVLRWKSIRVSEVRILTSLKEASVVFLIPGCEGVGVPEFDGRGQKRWTKKETVAHLKETTT